MKHQNFRSLQQHVQSCGKGPRDSRGLYKQMYLCCDPSSIRAKNFVRICTRSQATVIIGSLFRENSTTGQSLCGVNGWTTHALAGNRIIVIHLVKVDGGDCAVPLNFAHSLASWQYYQGLIQ